SSTFHTWRATITETLTELSQSLLLPIVSALPTSIERLILLPSGELFLLPLHAASLTSNDSELACDRYPVSYTPSLPVLTETHTKVKERVEVQLYAVVNPEEDPKLIFTPVEGAAIAQLFVQHEVDEGLAGTKQRVLAGVQGHSYVHFSCHGSYRWND